MSAHALGLWVLFILAVAPPPAHAQTHAVPTPLVWHCVQEFDEHANVMCIPRFDADAHADAARDALSIAPIPTRRGGTDMRPVAMRGDATVLSFEAWRVPLLVQPTDLEHVELLLKAVLCGRRPACTVYYGAPDPASNLHAAAR